MDLKLIADQWIVFTVITDCSSRCDAGVKHNNQELKQTTNPTIRFLKMCTTVVSV